MVFYSLNLDVTINPLPQEVPNPVRCDEDELHASYGAAHTLLGRRPGGIMPPESR